MQIQSLDLIIFLVFTLGTVLFGSSCVGKDINAGDHSNSRVDVNGFIVDLTSYVFSLSTLHRNDYIKTKELKQ